MVTTEIYAKFSLRRLESDFPSLVNSIKNSGNWKSGHGFSGHTINSVSANSII